MTGCPPPTPSPARPRRRRAPQARRGRPRRRRRPAARHRRGAHARLDGRRGAAPHAHHRPRHLLVAAAARSTGARATPPATSSTCASVALDCDGDAVLVRVDQVGRGLPHRRAHLLRRRRPRRRRRRRRIAEHGIRARARRRRPTSPTGRPGRASTFPRAGPRPPGRSPSSAACSPTARRRSGSTASSPATGPAPSCWSRPSTAASWSRYSIVGVRSAATLTELDGEAHWIGDAARRACRRPATRCGAARDHGGACHRAAPRACRR